MKTLCLGILILVLVNAGGVFAWQDLFRPALGQNISGPYNEILKFFAKHKEFSTKLKKLAEEPPEALLKRSFIGKWSFTGGSTQLFDFFDHTSGKIKMEFIEHEKMNSSLCLYDHIYIDEKIGLFEIHWETYTSTDRDWSWEAKNLSTKIFLLERLEQVDMKKENCSLDATLKVTKKGDEDFDLVLNVKSTECPVNFSAALNIDQTNDELKLLLYAALSSFVGIVLLVMSYNLLNSLNNSREYAKQISLISVGMSLIWDCELYSVHSSLAVNFFSNATFDYFYFFLIPGVLFLLQFFLEFNLLLRMWDYRYSETYMNRQDYLKGMIMFLVKFIVLFFGGMYLLTHFIMYNWVLVIASLFYIPQVIHSGLRGGTVKDKLYILGLFPVKILIPLYFRGCPHNFFELTPSYSFAVSISIVMIVQVGFVLIQCQFGSRFFVPSCFLPPQHKYFVQIESRDDEESQDKEKCAICLNNLNEDPSKMTTPLINSSITDESQRKIAPAADNKKKPKKIKVMKTPCSHYFHITCLKEWMNIKMECPTCRTNLPEING